MNIILKELSSEVEGGMKVVSMDMSPYKQWISSYKSYILPYGYHCLGVIFFMKASPKYKKMFYQSRELSNDVYLDPPRFLLDVLFKYLCSC